MHRTALTVTVLAALTLGGGGVAHAAADSTTCTTAKEASAEALVAYNGALNKATLRAKALGFTAEEIDTAKGTLADGKVSAAEQAKLLALYAARDEGAKVDVATDLPLLKAVLDTRLAWNAAVAAQNIACAGTSSVVTPSLAPATGDGSTR